jgi:hypothetical protein
VTTSTQRCRIASGVMLLSIRSAADRASHGGNPAAHQPRSCFCDVSHRCCVVAFSSDASPCLGYRQCLALHRLAPALPEALLVLVYPGILLE